jgi:chromosome segregation ATPase
VLGPLGNCVKVKDGYDRFLKPLEAGLGTSLRMFLVTCDEDQRRLAGILRRRHCAEQHSIYTQRPRPRYNPPRPDGNPDLAQCTLMQDLLIIENDAVYNCLVDRNGIENTIVVNDERDLRANYLRKFNGHDTLPRGIKSAIDIEATTYRYVNGNQAFERFKFDFKRLLQTDMKEVVRGLQEQCATKHDEVQHLQVAKREIDQQVNAASNELKTIDQAMRGDETEQRRLQRRKSELEQQLTDIQAKANIDTSEQESEAEQLRGAIATINLDIEERNERVSAAETHLRERQTEKSEIDRRRSELRSELKTQEDALLQFIDREAMARKEVAAAKKLLTQKENLLNEHNRAISRHTSEKDKLEKAASDETRRLRADWDEQPMALVAGDNESRLTAKLKSSETKYEKEQEKIGARGISRDLVNDRLQKAKADFEKSVKTYEDLMEKVEMLEEDFKQRTSKWERTLKTTSKKVKEKFNDYLNAKGFSGTIRFDHEGQALR